MKYFDGSYITCRGSGKVCYSGREAGEIINSGKRHHRSVKWARKTTQKKEQI